MAKTFYVGVNDIARNVKQPYCEVNNVARAIKKGYVGVNGVGRVTYDSKISGWFTFADGSIADNLIMSGYVEMGIKTFSFPFLTIDGFSCSSITIDDSMMAQIYSRMYYDNTLVHSSEYGDGFSYNDPMYWRSRNDKSIYLDNLELGVDISEEAYNFLLTVAYSDDTLGGKPQTYTLEAGSYTFITPISNGSFPPIYMAAVDMSVPFYSNGSNWVGLQYWYYVDIIDAHYLYYISSDGTRKRVYEYSYYDTGGWTGAYNYATLLSDAQVSKSAYDWWALNTKKS